MSAQAKGGPGDTAAITGAPHLNRGVIPAACRFCPSPGAPRQSPATSGMVPGASAYHCLVGCWEAVGPPAAPRVTQRLSGSRGDPVAPTGMEG